MGRFRVRLSMLLVICCLVLFSKQAIIAFAAEIEGEDTRQDFRLEQVVVNKPEIVVYYTGSESLKDAECYLGTERLTWKHEVEQEKIEYYIALDISGSISDSYFNQIKEALKEFCKATQDKESVMFYTFGETVQCLLQGDESLEEQLTVLETLDNRDQETLLFECLAQVAQSVERQSNSVNVRKVVLVITDGEDVALGKQTTSEALALLKRVGIPVYGLGIHDTKEEHLNQFGEFARATGGNLSVFRAQEAVSVIMQLQNSLREMRADRFLAESNLVSNSMESFTITLPETGEKIYRDVLVSRWIKDEIVPEILQVQKVAENQLQLEFSEPVIGADKVSSYQVMRDATPIVVGSVTYRNGEMPKAILTFSEPLLTGVYEVTCTGITDISVESNMVVGSVTVSVAGMVPQEIVEQEPQVDIAMVLLIAVVVILFVLVFILLFTRKRKKTTVVVDGKRIASDEIEIKQHVKLQNMKRKKIMICFVAGAGSDRNLATEIVGSLIAGRSDICALYFDDPNMSKQHFALETDGESVWISDLDSLNGTFVNGRRIGRKQRLNNGDEVRAGSVKMKIRW